MKIGSFFVVEIIRTKELKNILGNYQKTATKQVLKVIYI